MMEIGKIQLVHYGSIDKLEIGTISKGNFHMTEMEIDPILRREFRSKEPPAPRSQPEPE